MAGSLNKVQLIGNLGKDPEVRSLASGTKVANLSIATSETWNDRQSGERKEKTEWHRVSIYNERLAEVAEKYLRKGRKVYLEGQLETRKYTDKDGEERYSTEVVLRQFRGELTILDARQDEDDRPSPRSRDSGSGGRGRDDRGGYDRGRDDRGRDDRGRDDRRAAGNGRDRDPPPRGRDDDRRSPRDAGGGPTWTPPQRDADLDDEIPF